MKVIILSTTRQYPEDGFTGTMTAGTGPDGEEVEFIVYNGKVDEAIAYDADGDVVAEGDHFSDVANVMKIQREGYANCNCCGLERHTSQMKRDWFGEWHCGC
jgi:hypothetical protein